MNFSDRIFGYVWDIADFFYDLAFETRGIPLVGSFISNIFYNIYVAFWRLLTPINQFTDWVLLVNWKFGNVVTEANLWNILATPIKWAYDSMVWILFAWNNITQVINSWWAGTSVTVQYWINSAIYEVKSLIQQANGRINALKSSLDSFLVYILPNLATWTGVKSLIDAASFKYLPF